jgi:PAS domain S-box-containing protein
MTRWRARSGGFSAGLLAVVLFLWAPTSAISAEPDRVLVLHSYHKGFEWTDSLQAGIEKTFAENGRPVEFSVEYMDTKRHPDEILSPALAQLFSQKCERWAPNLILSCDDDALHFLFTYRDWLFPDVPVVFCGLNVADYDPSLLEGRSGYTGVVEKLDLASTIALIPRVQPEVTRVAFIHDRTTSGNANRRMVETLAPQFADRLTFVFPDRDWSPEGDSGPNSNGGLSERELFGYLEGLRPDTAVFFLGFYRDRFDASLELKAILPKISRAAPVPVYGYVESYMGQGILGGKLLSGEIHGSSAARKALRILQGESVAEIPVTVESSNRFMFDDRQRLRFRIAKKRLPPDAILLNIPPSFLERHSVALGWSLVAGGLVVLFFMILFFNMSRRLRAEERAAASERKYRLLADHSADVIWTMDAEHRLTYISPAIEKLSGYTPEEFLNLSFEQWMTPQTLESARSGIAERRKNWDGVNRFEQEMIRRDGSIVWTEVVAQGLRDERGQATRLVGSTRDITDRRRAEADMRESERRYREIYQRTPVMLHSIGADGRLVSVSDYWLKVMGYEREDVIGRPSTDFLTEESRRLALEEYIPHFMETREAWNVPYQFVKKSGEVMDVLMSAIAETGADGRFVRSLAALQDVTDQKRAEETLARQARQMRLAQQMARLGYWNYDIASDQPEWSEMMFEIFGWDPEKGVPGLENHREFIHPGDWEKFQAGVRGAENGVPYGLELRVIHPDGRVGYVMAHGYPKVDPDGKVRQLFGITQDITERKEAEQFLRESEERLRLVLEASDLGFWDWDIPAGVVRRNERWATMLGFSEDEIPDTVREWSDLIHPEDKPAALRSIQDHLDGKTAIHAMEYRMRTKAGESRWIFDRARIVRRDPEGKPLRMCGTHQDITDRKRREEQAHQAARRREITRRHQSLSTMAGAVAHNFNNMLMAVLGNLDIALSEIARFDPSRELIQSARQSAMQAAGLSRLMLLYVGQGQDRNETVCLLDLILSQKAGLRELAPPGIWVRFPAAGREEPCWIRGDRARLAEAVRNLVINAAEAVGPSPGEIAIGLESWYLTASELEDNFGLKSPEEGRFVGLSVSDTGCGMSEETRRRLFEPYYTTKFTGRGLGLAMVLGIVRGHGGAIQVRSEEGAGSRVTLFFPEAERPGSDPAKGRATDRAGDRDTDRPTGSEKEPAEDPEREAEATGSGG